ncbi:MAG: type I-D CRISPR-associated protein Cas10d/Csc3 [Caldilinea sp.]
MKKKTVQPTALADLELPEDSDLEEEGAFFGEEPDEEASGEQVWPAEPLFAALLRDAVRAQWGEDPVLTDFVDHVAAPLSELLGHVAAKGGDFAAERRVAKGAAEVERYGADQSLRAHLINGLFPVLHVARALQAWGAPQLRCYDDTVRRLWIAGFVLHDWLKLPEVDQELEELGLRHDRVNAAQQRGVVEAIFERWGERLGLAAFLEPVGGLAANLHELIFLACNTQVKWGTLRNLAALPELHLPGAQRALAEQLCRLADYLAYVGRSPREAAAHRSIHSLLAELSDQQAQLAYHQIADVRGVLTNLIQNAALAAGEAAGGVPLLYSPNGVVYLTRRGQWQAPAVQPIGEAVVARLRQRARQRLENNLTGFGRDGHGIKYADYYHLFFEPIDLMAVALKATLKIVNPAKAPAAGKRWDKLSGWVEVGLSRDQMDDVRVDQLAEWAYLAETMGRDLLGREEVPLWLLDQMGLADLRELFLAVPRDNRAGGVGYHWYLAAAHALHRRRGLDPQAWEDWLRDQMRGLSLYLRQKGVAGGGDGFGDLRRYVEQVLSFGSVSGASEVAHFAVELQRYSAAKTRGKAALCALCSSSYQVEKQQETASLSAPQVYSNKLGLHGTDARRNICSICGLEMMLRQLLMKNNSLNGGKFEALKMRYLYFYPAYFFTPETLRLFRRIQNTLRGIRFTELKSQLLEKMAGREGKGVASCDWQHLQDLMLEASDQEDGRSDRHLRMRFSEDELITFFFLGVPLPDRDAKDAESWVHPAWLALLLPLCIDVKVVASESSLPLFNGADEFTETVIFDGAHASIRYLLGPSRVNLDHVLPLLNRLTVAYFIHLDANASRGQRGYDYRWQDLPPLARRLSESSLHAFHYLKKWQRSVKQEGLPSNKIQCYLGYQALLDRTKPNDKGEKEMSHARTLTELYWRFYRAKSLASSAAILRPLTVAANAVLAADRRLYGDAEGLVEIVRGELAGFVDRVASRRAEGHVPRVEINGQKQIDQEAVRQFAAYFVNDLFYTALRGDVSALRGRQLNLLKNACEVLYRDLRQQEWAERNSAEKETSADLEEAQTRE